jgi:hypothetical protein
MHGNESPVFIESQVKISEFLKASLERCRKCHTETKNFATGIGTELLVVSEIGKLPWGNG